MKVLIFSCRADGGEREAALAVRERLEEHGHHVTMLELCSFDGIGKRMQICIKRRPSYEAGSRSLYSVQEYLQTHEFDLIILTHSLPAVILSVLKDSHIPLPPLIYVAGDYACAPFVEETSCDGYVIPSEKLIAEFCRRGVPKERILPAGIPVRKEFLTGQSREQARKTAGMREDRDYLLLLAGRMRPEKLYAIIWNIQKYLDFHHEAALVIAGLTGETENRLVKAYEGDRRIEFSGSHCSCAVYMKACDVLISGAEGMISTEAAVLGIPLIQVAPAGSFERRNAEFFSRYGMSIVVRRPGLRLVPALEKLSDSVVRQKMIEDQQKYVSRLAAAEICNLAESSVMAVEAGSESLLV